MEIQSPFPFVSAMTGIDIVSVLFTIIFVLWAVYTLISIYHWVRYGHDSWISWPAIGVHLVVSAALMLFAVSGFQ